MRTWVRRLVPFHSFKRNTPKGAENDDAGHVHGPTGVFGIAHAGFAHAVEEELQVPGDAGNGGEDDSCSSNGARWRSRG